MNTTKKLMALLLAVLAMSFLSACNKDGIDDGDVVYMLPETKPIQLSAEQKQMRDNNNEFAWRLFRTTQEAEGRQGSSILSPLSVTYLLGMMDAGAAGSTRDEITDVLGFGNDAAAVNEYCKKMIDGSAIADPAATVKTANCIEVNSALGIGLLPQFVENMKHYYYAQIEALDFTKGNVLDRINSWCKDHTDGMIPSILDQLSTDMAMIMLNAIYFKADWNARFDKQYTRKMDFTLPNGTTAKRDLMHIKVRTFYGQNDSCSVVRLPFGSGAYGMYILLPAEGVSLEELIQGMNYQDLNANIYNNTYLGDIDILLPKFETSNQTQLIRPLSDMGIKSAFDPFSANFSNMTNASLCVSQMFQKAKIEVNEDGAKAAAVTMAGFTYTSYEPYQNFDFHATRPFLYLILEESTRSLFFIGTYCGD
jgi:serpin B